MKNFIAGLLTGGIITVCCFVFLKEPSVVSTPVVQAEDTTIVPVNYPIQNDSVSTIKKDTVTVNPNASSAKQGFINRDSLVAFAKTLMGVPYLYGSTDPAKGFDCSGFITYVFNHFKMKVPRSSYDFANVGKKVELATCKKGDLILFTGTAPEERTIGHIGIVIDNSTGIPIFIHSSSGKANGVTTTSMESVYYQGRFVSVVDILTTN